MKSKAEAGGHWLSELTTYVTEQYRRAAMEKYIASDMHATLMVAGILIEQCEASTKKLSEGKVESRLDICCCGDTFANIMSCVSEIVYKGCDVPETDDGEQHDRKIDDATFAKLAKMPLEKLREKLSRDYDCMKTEYGQYHTSDKDLQDRYYRAVLERFNAAIRYAIKIGSDSAKAWIEAVRLITPATDLVNAVQIQLGLGISEDDAAEAYKVAEMAQGQLWVDSTFYRLTHAKPVKSVKRAKGGRKGR